MNNLLVNFNDHVLFGEVRFPQLCSSRNWGRCSWGNSECNVQASRSGGTHTQQAEAREGYSLVQQSPVHPARGRLRAALIAFDLL